MFFVFKNIKQFLIVEHVFLNFYFGEQEIILKNSYQIGT